MSESIDDGGHAYPTLFTTPDIGSGFKGMTLRDWFAGQAIAGFAANPKNREWTAKECANDAYQYADAMIKARKEKQ